MHQHPAFTQQSPALGRLVVPGIIIAHLFAFSASVTAANFPTKSFALVLLGIMFSCVASCATFIYSKSNVPKVVSVFLVATCTLKLPLCLTVPETTFLEVLPLKDKLLSEVVCAKFFWFSLGFLGFSVGAIAASRFFWNMLDPRKRDMHLDLPERGFVTLLFAYGTIQCMRAYLLLVLQIGAPNIEGREFLVPKLAGILNILGTRGLFVLVTALLAWALARRSILALLFAVLAGMGYAGVEMAGGWRSGLYYYVLCGLWVYFSAEPSKLKDRLKPFALGLVVLAVVLFVPIMDYRNNLNRGMSQTEAVRAVLEGTNDNERDLSDKFYKIVRRFNGLDLYVVASHGSEGMKLGAMSLFNGRASQLFTFGILGTPEGAVTTSGMTIWGSIAIAFGDAWEWLGGLLVGVLVGGLPVFCRRWFHSSLMRTTFECSVTITILAIVMGNGALGLYSKQLVGTYLVCLFVKFLTSTESFPAFQVQRQMNHHSPHS